MTCPHPIVAIGASAGGLEAMRRLFAGLPDDTGMAFVVIQHLDPGRTSMLASVLAADIRMSVVEVTGRTRPEPDHVYVIPPDADLSIHGGVLELVRRQSTKLHLPIDTFFRALAADLSDRAIGVVLSGSASDGTEGLRAIKAAGGITFAQEPESAQFPSMPESAIAAGAVDFQRVPEDIASELVRLSRHEFLARQTDDVEVSAEKAPSGDAGAFAKILSALQRHAQLDFRGYKRPTMMRRIAKRMALRHLGSMNEYADLVRDDPGESMALAQDVLIQVTSFFRDAAAFEALKRLVLPQLLKHKDDDATIRVWVPGCSSGEEAYSIAICLVEFLAEQQRMPAIKIFGSDLSNRAIETARAGLYTESAVEGVSPERLARFFERAGGRYRISREIRDVCVFVRHDLTRDSPFAKLDLISCRNVLIYFDADLQRRVLPLLHHCLNQPGYLFLGSSEGIRELEDLFVPIDKEHRLFLKTGESPRIEYPVALAREAESQFSAFHPMQRPQTARDAQRQADHVLLARYAPPGVVVNERLEVVQFRGRTGDYLEPPPGQPQTNVLKLARAGLAVHLREALEAAQAKSITVRRPGVRVSEDARAPVINLEVVPLPGISPGAEHHFLIIFEELDARERSEEGPLHASASQEPPAAAGPPDEEVARLKTELIASRDYVRAITGENQDIVEQLGAANEELIAANEELQSTNEELQSAKEELQSTNEELTTLNEELNNRNQLLDEAASDLVNVLESVQIPVIMVDEALRVRRFTPTAREISSLLPGDVGRSIEDVRLKLKIDDLVDRIRETIESVTPKEYEVQGLDGRWYKLYIRPYRTTDKRLDGAVLSFLDVNVLKRALQESERARDYANRIVETVPMSLAVLDRSMSVVSANPPFYQRLAMQESQTEHIGLFEIGAGALRETALREVAERSLSARTSFHDLEIRCAFPVTGRRDLVIAGSPIEDASGNPMLLLAIEDRTERHLLEESEKQARIEAEQANRAKDLFLATLSHELRTPLSTILMSAQFLKRVAIEDPKLQQASLQIERAVGNQVRLIDDLLDISRIVSGKLMLDLQAVDLVSITQIAIDAMHAAAEARGIAIELITGPPLRPVLGDPGRLQQVVANLLHNSIKFTPKGGRITVSLEALDDTAKLTVTDTGLGLRPEIIPHLFDRFVQAEGSMTRAHGGLGLGLAIVQHIVGVHGGEIRAESPGEGMGSTFTVTLPMIDVHVIPDERTGRTVTRSISGVRVLLIEDDDDTRQAVASMLEVQGASVRTASSVKEGLAALKEGSPQVIICDIAMPGEDGYTFIHKLRSGDHAGKTLPAAALTALAGEGDRRRALEAGFDMHLAKPIDADRLATAVATLAAQS